MLCYTGHVRRWYAIGEPYQLLFPHVLTARCRASQEHIDAQRLAPCGSALLTITCKYWTKIASSTEPAWSSVMRVSWLNINTNSARRTPCTSKKNPDPAALLLVLFPPVQYAVSRQCSGMGHAQQMIAGAATDEAAELFCQRAPRLTQAVL